MFEICCLTGTLEAKKFIILTKILSCLEIAYLLRELSLSHDKLIK